jgi:hypothetical protein
MGDGRREREHKPELPHPEPPGQGDSIEDASREAVAEMEKTGNSHAGTGDAG